MRSGLNIAHINDLRDSTALESNFPIGELSRVAQLESWRKEINRPLYHIHKWWATRLGSVFRALVLGALSPANFDIWKNFYHQNSLKGKIVLDPFMGSGTTLGEALKLNCKVIGCDINPVSSFLVRQALTPTLETTLRAAFHEVEKSVANEIRQYYKSSDQVTGKDEDVLHYFWVCLVVAPTGETIPLFSRYVFCQDAYPKKKPQAQIICPQCWSINSARYDETNLTCAKCCHTYNPQQGPVKGSYVYDSKGQKFKIKDLVGSKFLEQKMYAKVVAREGRKIYLSITASDEALFVEAAARLSKETLPLPNMPIRSGHNTNQARSYNYKNWRDFFNSRQLLSLGLTLKKINEVEDKIIREQLLCLFSGTLEFNNMFCSFKGEGTGAVRHIFSNHILKPERTPLENNPWYPGRASGTFGSLFESRLIRAKDYLDNPFEIMESEKGTQKVAVSAPLQPEIVDNWEAFSKTDKAAFILNGDSASLPIPDCSVDAVITDPPYFDFIHYSELSDFFFAWLSPVLSSEYSFFTSKDSYRPEEVQHKEPRVFAAQLARVFKECCRVLKDEGLLVFSFHHSKPEGWLAIFDAVKAAGMIFVAAHPIHAEVKSSSIKSQTGSPISLDAILICKKDGAPISEDNTSGATDIARLIQADLKISVSDRFVIAASKLLVEASSLEMHRDWLQANLLEQYNLRHIGD